MSKITQENFEEMYIDPIEIRQIDKFVCQEMGRQMHRYIKGMSGSKRIMEKLMERREELDDFMFYQEEYDEEKQEIVIRNKNLRKL